MAESATALDLKEVLTTEDLSTDRLHEVRRDVHSHVDLRSQLEELLAEFGSKIAKSLSSENKAEVRKGTARWLLGQSEEAVKILQPLRASKEKSYVLGLSYLEAGRPQDAVASLGGQRRRFVRCPHLRRVLRGKDPGRKVRRGRDA